MDFQKFILGICNCGCNEYIPIQNTQGYLQRYKNHHNSRLKGEKHQNWKGGKSRLARGYNLIYNPLHYESTKRSGYLLEHRYIMEQYLDRPLTDTEEVHHIDYDKTNNNIDNLIICNKSQHRFIENLERKIVTEILLNLSSEFINNQLEKVKKYRNILCKYRFYDELIKKEGELWYGSTI